jgi:hypothetical protein
MHQGWPKFVTHLWMQTQDGGIAAVAYAPSRLSTTVQGVPISIELITDYPFSSQLKFVVETASPLTFPLHLRIPGWAQSAVLAIDGLQNNLAVKQGSPRFETIKREWKGKTEVVLTLGMTPRIERRYRDAIALWRGPLVFSLKIGEDWRKVAGEEPHADWEVWPTTAWNYGLVIDEKNPQGSIEVEAKELKGNPFSQATTPVTLKVKGRRIPEWRLVKNAADAPPQSPVVSSSPLETLTLIPYGAAKLRITEFPVVK